MQQRNAILAVSSVFAFALTMILLSCAAQPAHAQSPCTLVLTGPAGFSGSLSSAQVVSNVTCAGSPIVVTPPVTPPVNPPVVEGCKSTQVSDTPYQLNRLCNGFVFNPYLSSSSPAAFDQYANVYGAWPVSASVSGSTRVITLLANQFVSLAFQPAPSATVKVNANGTYGGGTLSVSTVPGGFTKGDTAYGVVCVAANNGSSSVQISSNGTQGPCPVKPGQTYYLNISSVKSTGQKGCLAASCNAAFTVTQVN